MVAPWSAISIIMSYGMLQADDQCFGSGMSDSWPFDPAVYRPSNRVERLINRLKQFRRLATRYDKRDENYRTLWLVVVTIPWL